MPATARTRCPRSASRAHWALPSSARSPLIRDCRANSPARAGPPLTSTRSTSRSRAGGFAQGPGGQQQAVAQPPLAVEHRNLQVPVQAVVLEAVVRDDDVHALRHQSPARRNPVRVHADRRAGLTTEQQRLVADLRRIVIRRRPAVALRRRPPAIAPADDAGTQARLAAEARPARR